MRWAGHIAYMGAMRNERKTLVGNPEGKRPLGRLRRRWEIILEWILWKQGGKERVEFIWFGIG
jgi:hypothetical protein